MSVTYPMAHVTAPGKIEFLEKELAPPGEREVLIAVRAAAICGSDLHIFKGKHPSAPLPVSVGHEIAGEVLETGPGVSRLRVGERVTVEPVIACGRCEACRKGQYHLCQNISFQYRRGQGGFGKYFVVSEAHAFRLPEQISYAEGALVEPLAVALHALKRSELRMGERCAIFGAGAIGLLLLMLAQVAGAGCTAIVDVQDFRLQKALELGASRAINARLEDVLAAIHALSGGQGVERSFEAVGLEGTLMQALQALKKGGRATLLGIFEDSEARLPVNLFVQREIALAGSQGYNWDFQDGLALLEQGKLDLKPLITHRLKLEALQEGFELLSTPGNRALKVVVEVEN